MNAPIVALGLLAVVAIIPESRAPGDIPLDPVGAGLSVVALTALTYGIIEAPGFGWSDPRIFGTIGLALVLAVLFARWERRLEHPMLDIKLFRNPRFSAACVSVTLSFFALNGALFLVTMYLQQVRGLSPLDTAFRFIGVAAGFIAAAPVSAWMTNRYGARITATLGLAMVAVGLGLFATIGLDSSDAQVLGLLMLTAAGIVIAMTPVTDAIMGAVPAEKFGVGSAVNDTTRELGGALGIAILGSVFQGSFAERMGPAVAGLPAPLVQYGSVIKGSFAGAAGVAASIGPAGASLIDAARHAFVDAQAFTCLVGMGFGLAGVVVAAVFLPARAEQAAEGGGTAAEGGRNERSEAEGRTANPA